MKIQVMICAVIVAAGIIFSSLSVADPVWIDVRTLAENQNDNIEGDPLIPHTSIVKVISENYPDKETDIRLYCRTGNRAGQALNALKLAGYHNVQNIGSIGDARKARGLIH